MADVTFVVSAGFLTRMRAVMVAEQPALAGQTAAVINEAARVRVRKMIRDWVVGHETGAAVVTAQASIAQPGDADIL